MNRGHGALSRRVFLVLAGGTLVGVTAAAADKIVTLIASSAGGPPDRGPQAVAGWEMNRHNPVLGGSLGTCFDVCVLRERGIYRMWFSWRPRHSIALVESRDGIHWSRPRIVLAPRASGWEDDLNRPSVIRTSSGYAMWYTGQTSGSSAIGYALSRDGVNWTRPRSYPVLSAIGGWEESDVMSPDILYDPATGHYRMWYSAGSHIEPNAIGHAWSADGLHWTRTPSNPIFTPDARHTWEQNRVTACHVVRDGGWYTMFYIGFQNQNVARIGLARSRDGLTGWQRHPANPILRRGPAGSWDADAVYKPYALQTEGGWMLWYNGRKGRLEQIGLARHPGRNLGFPSPALTAAPTANL